MVSNISPSLLFALGLHFLGSVAGDVAARAPERTRFLPGKWTLEQQGTSGVSAMQLMVLSETTALILDKAEHNPLQINGHFAWVAELNLNTKTVRALNARSNTWCATGSFLSNGTAVSSAGNFVVFDGVDEDGYQAIRLFTPCEDGNCDLFEDQSRVRLASKRWYPSSVRVDDGSVLVFGGSYELAYWNNASVINPSYEFFPPKNIHGYNGVQIPSEFLLNSINASHFPIITLLPDGKAFVAANQGAMIFDWKTNTERLLPGIPNGVRISSPFSAGAVLLPLTPENNYTPEIMICGGSTESDAVDFATFSSQMPTSSQCSRMVLNEAGIAAGWKVEHMPYGRVMMELVLLPDHRVLIVNGAKTGVAGYGLAHDLVGNSTADNPAFTPIVYDPSAPAGRRFSSVGMPTSDIPRMYHSTASLTPNGTILLAGSNPNPDFSTNTYATEYRLEWLSPPYMAARRPSYTGLPATIDFNTTFELTVNLPPRVNHVSVSLIDLGFATHGVHMDQRLVKLKANLSHDKKKLTVTAPPSAGIYPPGPAFLYVVTDAGVPSFGHKTLVGTGASPPVDEAAIENMLASTNGPPGSGYPSGYPTGYPTYPTGYP